MSSLPSQPEDLNRDVAGGELPDALAAELRAMYGATMLVPPAVDAAILREARGGFARRRRFRLAVRGAIVTAAAAAAVALAFVIPALMKSDAPRQQAVALEPATTPAAGASESWRVRFSVVSANARPPAARVKNSSNLWR